MSNVSAQVCESDTFVWRLTMNRSLPNADDDVALCLLPRDCSMGKPVASFVVNKRSAMSFKRHKCQAGHRTIDGHTPVNNGTVTTRGGNNNVQILSFLSRGSVVILRLRGLPYDCSATQVVEFFSCGEKGGSLVYGREEGVVLVKRPDGRSSGDAFVVFESDDQAEKALRKHRDVIGSRYIEVFRSTLNELQQVLRQNSEFPVSNPSPPPPLLSTLPPISVMSSPLLPASRKDCIRLRGLPYEAHVEHVLEFLKEHAKNIILQGVHMVYNAQGQPSGEAFIQMNSEQSAFAASQLRHHKYMVFGKKQRYIEVFQCSAEDVNLLLAGNYSFHRTLFSSGGSGLPMSYGMHLPPPPVLPVVSRVPTYYTPIFYWPYPSPPVSPANYYNAPLGPATVLMRGLPFSASVADVITFFQGCSELSPECIRIQHSPDGRPNGEALVTFPTIAEAELAIIERHRHTIGTRYIELFAA